MHARIITIVHPSPPVSNATINYDEIKEIATEPIKNIIRAQIKTLTPLFFKLDLAIYGSNTIPGFITSDGPCVWIDLKLPNYRILAGNALVSPTIEIHLPLLPSQSLFLNRRGKNGYIKLSSYGSISESKIVMDTNWRISSKARKFLIVNQKIIHEKWFKPYQMQTKV